MKKTIVLIIALILCFSCSFSAAERKTVEKDKYYLGAMRITNCREYVSLRERPDKTSRVLAKVPLDGIVQNCNNNVKKYKAGKYKKQYNLFIRCEYDGIEGYILKKHLVPAPEAELAETRQENKTIINKGPEIPVHHILGAVDRQVNPVIHHIIMIEIISADPVASVTPADLVLPVLGMGGCPFFTQAVQQA